MAEPPRVPPGARVELPPADARQFLRFGQVFLSEQEALAVANSAARLAAATGQPAHVLSAFLASGAAATVVCQVVEKFCGPQAPGPDPFANLQPWARELFERLGVVRLWEQQRAAADPDAPPKPVESIAELRERARKAGITLA